MATSPTIQQLVTGPPSDEETLALWTAPDPDAARINDLLVNHPVAKALRKHGDFVESRPHLKIPEKHRMNNLTGGVLAGTEKIGAPPLCFIATKGATSIDPSPDSEFLPEMICLTYVGNSLCGHPGIIHGGLLATLLDEGLARTCFPVLPNKIGVTASLKVDYKLPCKAGQVLVLRAKTTKAEGRKAWVTGWIEEGGDLETLEKMKKGENAMNGTKEGEDYDAMKATGNILCTAEGLFIEPRGAATMLARFYAGAAGTA